MHTMRHDTTVAAQLEHILHRLGRIERELIHIRRDQLKDKDTIMTALSDLQDAMAALVTEAVTDLEIVLAKIGTTPPDDTAALQALTQQANDAIAKLKSDMAPLTTPTPTPSPSPAPAPASTGTTDTTEPGSPPST